MSGPEATALPAAASRHALALLRFPDRRTDWVVVFAATLRQPVTDLEARLAELHRAVPVLGARLHDEVWHPGAPPTIQRVPGDPVGHPDLDRPFDLSSEAPLRILCSEDGRRLGLAGHHAALDGLGFVAIAGFLAGGALPEPVTSPPPGQPGSKLPLLKRLARPADRVLPTPGVWPGDTYHAAVVNFRGSGFTARMAEACTAAAVAHNERHGASLRTVGLTLSVGGPAGVGNVASYRRVDLPTDRPIGPAVTEALATPEEPGEQVSAPAALLRLLQPVVERFSDTLLLSNLSRHDLPGAEQIELYPVARGRSAVCFASGTVLGGRTTLTLRTRDLSPGEAKRLLRDAVDRLEADGNDGSDGDDGDDARR